MKSENKIIGIGNLKSDIPASIVVFLVALPLCLGIALASGAPLYSGVIGGIIGGIVVGSLSGSRLGVSGPAAGLTVIVLNAITDLGGFEIFLVASLIAGIIQIILGFLRAGNIAYYFPSAVIHGMLAGIGLLILLKQIPHAVGFDRDPEGDLEFIQFDGENTFTELIEMTNFISPGVVIITAVSLLILIVWNTQFIKGIKVLDVIPAPLLAVISGMVLSQVFSNNPYLYVSSDHFVSLPIATNLDDFFSNFTFPDFSALSNPKVYHVAIVMAVVASLETLLSVEASDKLDPLKRITPTNRELKAQGVGNIVSALIGGLPVTQVIVRSSANLQSGGKTKISTIIHGFLLLLSVLLIPRVINLIPFGTLAAILIMVGFKLAKPSIFIKMYKQGFGQFVPFVVAIIGIILTDLLKGILLGMAVAVFIILRNNFKIPYHIKNKVVDGRNKITVILSGDVTFLNKASVLKLLDEIENDSIVEIDASNTDFIHYDVMEIIDDFKISAVNRNIEVHTINL